MQQLEVFQYRYRTEEQGKIQAAKTDFCRCYTKREFRGTLYQTVWRENRIAYVGKGVVEAAHK